MTAQPQPLPPRPAPASSVSANAAAPPASQAAPVHPARLRSVGPLTLLTWPALEVSGADAAVTARSGGVSSGPYTSLNLSLSVGDDPALVLENRRRLATALDVSPGDFVFARQVHGTGVRIVGQADRGSGAFTLDDAIEDADALVTRSPGVVLAILTADCVPIVLHDPVAGVLACVHAGWRGTVARVCAAAVAAMESLGSRPSDIIAAVGPAVAPDRYQVGPDVHQAVTQSFAPPPSAAPALVHPNPAAPSAAAPTVIRPDPAAPGRWLLDLWSANRLVLREAGLSDPQIHITNLATGPTSSIGPTSPTSPEKPGDLISPTDPDGRTGPGYFFSDRAARPCGRLALVARLRAPGHEPMVVAP